GRARSAQAEPGDRGLPRRRGAVLGGRDRSLRHAELPSPLTGCRVGVLALGDSITNGGGELQWGVALQSWALWVARGLGLPYTGVAADGARAADVVAHQLPAVEAQKGESWDVGLLYVGVNDVRALHFD